MVKPVRLMGQFPPLPPGRAVRQIIVDGLLGQWRLLLSAATAPFIIALVVDLVTTIALELRGQGSVLISAEAIGIAAANLVIMELLLGAFFTTSVARLLGIGWRRGRVRFNEEWREAFGAVVLRLTMFYLVGLVLVGGGFAAYLTFREDLPTPQLAPFIIAVPALIQLVLYTRFSFVIAGAAVGAPYTFGDSIRATGGITLLMLGLYLVFCLPLVVAQLALQVSASTFPLFGLGYFGALILTQVLFLLRVAMFTIINLVCFVNRTGWSPGARRI